MNNRFKYVYDRRSRRITASLIFVIIAAFAAFIFLGSGSYLPAWFLSIAIATMALYILSIPRFIQVDDDYLEIHCIIELTKIHVGDIRTIRTVETSEMKSTFPLLGSYGFFGYYGYYFNWSEWEMVKMYAGEWGNFIEIEDIYEQKFIVSCSEYNDFIALVEQTKEKFISQHTPQENH